MECQIYDINQSDTIDLLIEELTKYNKNLASLSKEKQKLMLYNVLLSNRVTECLSEQINFIMNEFRYNL